MTGLNGAVNLLSSKNALHYQIWMFYVVVATGLLGFRFSETYKCLERNKRGMIIAVFLAFAASNFIAMTQNIAHFNAIIITLNSYEFSGDSLNLTSIFEAYEKSLKSEFWAFK